MNTFEYSINDPAHLLACDHALLDEREESGGENSGGEEVLVFWESASPFVVLGYTQSAAREANLEECARKKIPIFRRISGGGTVVQGRGCLNYCLVLRVENRSETANLSATNAFVMNQTRAALQTLTTRKIEVRGISDLAINGLKFSGNAQRRRRKFLLFHGTVLYDFDLELLNRVLEMPSRQPEYRLARSHRDFVTNLRVSPYQIKAALRHVWRAHRVLELLPQSRIETLVRELYSQDSWNFKL